MQGWELKQNDILLGRLKLRRLDQPWFFCEFEPTAAFQELAPLFETEVRLLETGLGQPEDLKNWERTLEKIDGLQLVLKPNDIGDPITEFLLHVDGEEAWFRY